MGLRLYSSAPLSMWDMALARIMRMWGEVVATSRLGALVSKKWACEYIV